MNENGKGKIDNKSQEYCYSSLYCKFLIDYYVSKKILNLDRHLINKKKKHKKRNHRDNKEIFNNQHVLQIFNSQLK